MKCVGRFSEDCLYIFDSDVLRGSSASQAALVQKIQSKTHKTCAIFIEIYLSFFLDELFDLQQNGKVETARQYFFLLVKLKRNIKLILLS